MLEAGEPRATNRLLGIQFHGTNVKILLDSVGAKKKTPFVALSYSKLTFLGNAIIQTWKKKKRHQSFHLGNNMVLMSVRKG